MLLVSLTTTSASIAANDSSKTTANSTANVSQKLTGEAKIKQQLNRVLPSIPYTVDHLSPQAQKVNNAKWQPNTKLNREITTKLQALLNWQHHGVGAVDGRWGKNTRKAMQAFQKAQGLAQSDELNQQTWDALTKNSKIATQPVLVNYVITDDDVNINTTTIPAEVEDKAKLDGMYYESLIEALAEKFHISRDYLQTLNPDAKFESGETITVYNPANPSTIAVSRVVADKSTQTLYAYDSDGNLVASYPTTVGSSATPSPSGTHKVEVKVYEPNYTYSHDNGSKSILPPGPNNPVGLVWIGLSKPTYGIHGSPDPERISRQASSGCVRLTNWDALALYGVLDNDATVEFK